MKKSYWLHLKWHKGAVLAMQPQYGIIFTLTPAREQGPQTGRGTPQAFFNSWEHLEHAMGLLGCGGEIENAKKSLAEHGSYLIQDVLLDDDELRTVGVELPHPVA